MNESKNLIKTLSETLDSGRNAAFVTVISVDGSTPREAGAKMLVFEDGSIEGTVGGGMLEAMSMKQAKECLRTGQSGKFAFDLTPKGNTGALCMGRMEIFVDIYKTPVKALILGAGHVGAKIAEACRLAGYPYIVADDRREFANEERFPGAMKIINELPHRAVKAAGVDSSTSVVIVTRGHALDLECLAAALKTEAAYIGMIGSAGKVKEQFKKLHRRGLYPEKDKRVHSPIGLNLGGKTPGEIAVSVLAEIIKLHYGRDSRHMRLTERLKAEG